jgi:type I restriction enzyme S subunit
VAEWSEVTVDDIQAPSPNALATGPFGSSISSRFFQERGVPVVRGSNLSTDVGTRLSHEKLVFLSHEKAQEFGRSTVRNGDLIFTCWGTIDQVGLIDERARYPEYVISNKQMKLTPDPRKADSLFLYYLFSGPEMSSRIRNWGIGSSVPGFNLGQLRSLKFRLPPLAEQRAISHVLGTFDDKIELSRQMNHTLEAIARAIFKSWFVDFDPVWAKANGEQPYGMDAETAALFPEAFVDSEMGSIPEGWQVKPLDRIAHFQNGIAWQRYRAESGEDSLPVIKIREMRQAGFDEKSDSVRSEIKQACKVYDGDVLFSWSASLMIDVWCSGDGALNQHIFKVTSKRYPKWFYYYWTRHHLDEFQRIAAGKVTTMGHIQRHHLSEALVVIPPTQLLRRMTKIIAPLLDAAINNRLESRTLAELRDTLLPRLISGELRVPEAEAAAEEV